MIKWSFNHEVSLSFYNEAITNIPDYEKVILMCIEKIKNCKFNTNCNILDIGSAIGYTIDKCINSGYMNTFGVESSIEMINSSVFKEKIYYSTKVPQNFIWDIVISNWTLHFIKDAKNYIQDIYNNMSLDGLFIMSNKVKSCNKVKEEYTNFKLSNGLDIQYINYKKESLKGVLFERSINWYIKVLQDIGFVDIEIINTNMMFITLCCRKK